MVVRYMLSKLKQKRSIKGKRSKVVIENGQISVRSPKAYLYLLPAVIVLVAFLFYPLIKILRMGFFERYVYITSTGTGFGLSSIKHVLADPVYQLALGTVRLWASHGCLPQSRRRTNITCAEAFRSLLRQMGIRRFRPITMRRLWGARAMRTIGTALQRTGICLPWGRSPASFCIIPSLQEESSCNEGASLIRHLRLQN